MNLDTGEVAQVKCSNLMDVDESSLNCSYQLEDSTEHNVIPASSADHRQIKGTSSYGKCNFVLPVTFFDIQTNLNYLNECCPLTIKVVDCDKHPWYYNKYLRSDLESQPAEENNNISSFTNNVSASNRVDIDLTDKMYDKYEELNYMKKQSCTNKSLRKKSKSNQGQSIKKRGNPRGRFQNEELKNKALRKMNLSKIDFKKNKGLIGLKITHRMQVLDNFPEDADEINNLPVDHSIFKNTEPVENEQTKKSVEPTVNNYEDEFMHGVNKALCDLGTTITPLNLNENTVNKISSETETKNKLKNSIDRNLQKVNMTKKKSSKGKKERNIQCQEIIKANATGPAKATNFQKCDILESKENKPTSKVVIVEEHDITKLKTLNRSKTSTEPPNKRIQKKNKEVKVKQNKIIQDSKRSILKKEVIQKQKITKDSSRSKSPIFSCHISKPNKHLGINSIPNLKAVIQKELSGVSDLEIVDLDKQSCIENAVEREKCSMKKDFMKKSPISSSQNEIAFKDNEMKNERKTDSKNNFTITAVSIDKLKYNSITKSYGLVAKDNVSKLGSDLNPKPSPCIQSRQDNKITDKDTSICNPDLTLTAVPKTNKNFNTNQVEQLPTENTSKSFHISPNTICQNSQTSKAYMPPIYSPHIDTSKQFKQPTRHRIPVQIQIPQRHNYRRDNPVNVSHVLPGPSSNFTVPPFSSPPAGYPTYNVNGASRIRAPFPIVYQKNLQQNINILKYPPPQNMSTPNGYWPCWFSNPPPIPPPPPPPPEKYENTLQKITPRPEMIVGKSAYNYVKRINIVARPPPTNLITLTDSDQTSGSFVSISKNNIPVRGMNLCDDPKTKSPINLELPNVTPVNSKTEMFNELQKESMKIDSEFSTNGMTSFGSEVQNPDVQHHTFLSPHPNKPDSGSQQLYPENDKKLNKEANNFKNVPSFVPDNKIVYSKRNEEQRNNIKRDDSIDWNVKNDEDRKAKNKDSGRKSNLSQESNKKRCNRPKAGPLCMKNRSGPFARYQTPPPTGKSPPNKGYSPPILPIPTFQTSLEMLAKGVQIQPNVDKQYKIPSKHVVKGMPLNPKKLSRKTLEYFYLDKDKKSLKKISLQDYQNRVSQGDGKCIVLKKDSSCKRAKRNRSSEHDQGYDSDATVKL